MCSVDLNTVNVIYWLIKLVSLTHYPTTPSILIKGRPIFWNMKIEGFDENME